MPSTVIELRDLHDARSEQIEPATIRAHQMQATVEASIPNAIEEFQNLDRAFSTESGDIAKRRGRYRSRVFLRFARSERSQFANRVRVIEKVMHDLKQLALSREFAHQLTHALLRHTVRIRQIAHPWRIETASVDFRQQRGGKRAVGIVERDRVVR